MFGDVIRRHRRRLGLTQQELADRAGLGVRSIRKLEAGRVRTPRPPTVRLLANAFGLTGDDRDRFCAAATGETPREMVTPAQLPPGIPWFTGRQNHLARLDSPGASVVVVSGTAGVGKTALAVHWAHRVAHLYPDGQLHVDLRGFHPTEAMVEPERAVRWFLYALDVPIHRQPGDLDAQIALYRSLLAPRRMLVILDNARDTDQVRPLLPGSPGCMAVVTSRNSLTGLVANGAAALTLDLFSDAEARELLAARIGAARVTAEAEAAQQIIARCARLPLALNIAAARATVGHPRTLAALSEELGDVDAGLDAFADADATAADVRAVFSWSYRALEPGAARLFRLLAVHPGPDIAPPAAASLAGVPVERAGHLLNALLRANLLTQPAAGIYTCHDLLRAYAIELTAAHDSRQQRDEALGRVLDHYLRRAYAADRRGRAHDGSTAPADGHRAMSWFSLGYILAHLGQHRHAVDCYRNAAGLYRELDDHCFQAGSLTHLGDSCLALGDAQGAQDAWLAALALHERA